MAEGDLKSRESESAMPQDYLKLCSLASKRPDVILPGFEAHAPTAAALAQTMASA